MKLDILECELHRLLRKTVYEPLKPLKQVRDSLPHLQKLLVRYIPPRLLYVKNCMSMKSSALLKFEILPHHKYVGDTLQQSTDSQHLQPNKSVTVLFKLQEYSLVAVSYKRHSFPMSFVLH